MAPPRVFSKYIRRHFFRVGGLLLLAAVLLLALGCAVRQPGGVSQKEKGPSMGERLLAAQNASLSQFHEIVSQKVRNSAFTREKLRKPPEAAFAGRYYSVIKRERAVVPLAKDVTAFAKSDTAICLGFNNGLIKVWSPWSCASLITEDESGYAALHLSSKGSIFVALGPESKNAYVFDLKDCGQIQKLQFPSPIQALTLSPQGQHLAVMDEAHSLWLGRASQGVQHTARLRFSNIGLHFTPGGRLLLAVDSAGWVTIWEASSGQQMDQFHVGGGPFVESETQGPILRLHRSGETDIFWNIPENRRIEPPEDWPRERTPYKLKEDLLSYRTPEQIYVREIAMQSPREIQVWFSPAYRTIKMRSADGSLNFYHYPEGTSAQEVQTGDWRQVEVHGHKRVFQIQGETFQAVDPVLTRQGHRLLCQSLPQERYILWWEKAGHEAELLKNPSGRLPARNSLRREAEVKWRTLPRFEGNDQTQKDGP